MRRDNIKGVALKTIDFVEITHSCYLQELTNKPYLGHYNHYLSEMTANCGVY